MKKLKVLLLMLSLLLVIPFGVFADEAKEESKEVKVYLFYGDGCGFCGNFKTWISEIEEDYGDKFELIQYEVWYNESNSNLMSAVAGARNEEPGGVPYIIIGNQSWDGFADDYKDEILKKIDSEYKQDPSERYDIMDYVDEVGTSTKNNSSIDKNTTQDALVLLIIIAVGSAVVLGIIVARRNTN